MKHYLSEPFPKNLCKWAHYAIYIPDYITQNHSTKLTKITLIHTGVKKIAQRTRYLPEYCQSILHLRTDNSGFMAVIQYLKKNCLHCNVSNGIQFSYVKLSGA